MPRGHEGQVMGAWMPRGHKGQVRGAQRPTHAGRMEFECGAGWQAGRLAGRQKTAGRHVGCQGSRQAGGQAV